MLLRDIIKKSRSYRRFKKNYRISEKLLCELIELARFSPSANNQQALKFMLSFMPERNNLIFPATRWAGRLKNWSGPKEGERPSAYIVILGDKTLSQNFWCDHGIVSQSILLGAVEKGLGGCILGAINRELLRNNLNIPDKYEILLILALGKPAEKVVLEDLKPDGDVSYYRDAKDVHHVPKRTLNELIIT